MVFATIALGMGVNLAGLNTIIHYMSKSVAELDGPESSPFLDAPKYKDLLGLT